MNILKSIFPVIIFIVGCTVNSQTVYTTKSGEKYHKSTCHYLKYSKREITLEKAKELNYTACSVCKPSTNKTKVTATAKASQTNLLPTRSIQKKTSATQCTGKTQAGKRCRRMTKNSSGRCYQH
ncbi:hypothetical protein [Tamlana flava]|uniref:hypothetical protein n=1 Tax=Tamlana flava TaxID=3158572 RepID=UPI00351BB5C0